MLIHQIVPVSLANGPGRRMVIWTQGCSIGCPGCFNPQTHAGGQGREVPASEIADKWLLFSRQFDLAGVTISGGEPTEQPEELKQLCEELRKAGCDSIVVFTGRYLHQIQRMPDPEFLDHCDVLIAGPYLQKHPESEYLYGSANKELLFVTDRHKREEFQSHVTEIIHQPDGSLIISGFPPENLKETFK